MQHVLVASGGDDYFHRTDTVAAFLDPALELLAGAYRISEALWDLSPDLTLLSSNIARAAEPSLPASRDLHLDAP